MFGVFGVLRAVVGFVGVLVGCVGQNLGSKQVVTVS